MSDEAIIMCVAVAIAHPTSVVEGSTTGWCVLCAEEIWISPTGQGLIEELNARPHCMGCALGLMEIAPDPHIQPPTPAQRAEIQHHLQQQQENQP